MMTPKARCKHCRKPIWQVQEKAVASGEWALVWSAGGDGWVCDVTGDEHEPEKQTDLPMPNEKFEGGHGVNCTVIASVWMRDDEPPITALLMLLRPEPPFYEVVDIEWTGTVWEATAGSLHHNINEATAMYAQEGGDI